MRRETSVVVITFGYLMVACAAVHGVLIEEHWQMSWFEGASFLGMTVGCLALCVTVPVMYGRATRAANRTVIVLGVVYLLGMIAAYFYVHYTQWGLPSLVDHEGPEMNGTISVVIETAAILTLLTYWWLLSAGSKESCVSRSPNEHGQIQGRVRTRSSL